MDQYAGWEENGKGRRRRLTATATETTMMAPARGWLGISSFGAKLNAVYQARHNTTDTNPVPNWRTKCNERKFRRQKCVHSNHPVQASQAYALPLRFARHRTPRHHQDSRLSDYACPSTYYSSRTKGKSHIPFTATVGILTATSVLDK